MPYSLKQIKRSYSYETVQCRTKQNKTGIKTLVNIYKYIHTIGILNIYNYIESITNSSFFCNKMQILTIMVS